MNARFLSLPSPVSALPPLVQQKATSLGDEGRTWVADLPGTIAALEQQWSVAIGMPFSGGSAAFVAPVTTVDGGSAVVKIPLPGHGFPDQVRLLQRAAGRGYVRVLAYDPDRQALLQEALGPSLETAALSPEQQIVTLSGMLQRAWEVRPDAEPTLDQVTHKARSLHALVSRLWRELGHPCSQAVVSQALRFADRRAEAARPEHAVVVHGDPHAGNALRSARADDTGYVFVDPDGFVADPAYDLGVVLRDWCTELLAADAPARVGDYCRLLSASTGVDARAVWEWGFLERVSTGLYVMAFGAHDMARPFLQTAEMLVSHGPVVDRSGAGRPRLSAGS